MKPSSNETQPGQQVQQQSQVNNITPPEAQASRNAFETLGGTEGANIPKKIAEFKQLKNIFQAGGVLVFGLFFAVFMYSVAHSLVISLVIAGAAIVGSILIGTLSFISFRQLRNAEKNPTTQAFNQFQTGTAVAYDTPSAPVTQVSAAEALIGWLGPVMRSDKLIIGTQVLSSEHNYSPANTLVFTNTQVLALMLGPQDVPTSVGGGVVNQALSGIIAYSDQDSVTKNVQFESLYSRKWEQIMEPLMQQAPAQLIGSHLAYSIPFSTITSFEVTHSFINAGITFHMADGTKRSFTCLRKDLLDGVVTFLRPYVAAKE